MLENQSKILQELATTVVVFQIYISELKRNIIIDKTFTKKGIQNKFANSQTEIIYCQN